MPSWRDYAHMQNHLWDLSNICDNGCIHIETFDKHDATTTLHTHNFIQIYYVLKGRIKHTVQDYTGDGSSQAILTTGDLFILPPWFYHQIVLLTDDVAYTSLCVAPEFVEYDFRTNNFFCKFINHLLTAEVVDKSAGPKCCISFGSETGAINALLNAMLLEYSQGNMGYLTYIKGELLKLLVIIARQYCENQAAGVDTDAWAHYYESVMQSIEYIDENFAEDLRLDDISKRFLISRSYYCKLFKHVTGRTFKEYLNHIRLNNSKNLLLSTDLCVSDVASLSGFHNVSNFCRQFKQAYSISSTDYRKTARRSGD